MCSFHWQDESELNTHMRREHFRCRQCHLSLDSKEDLDNHMMIQHPDDLICHFCGYRASSFNILSKHVNEHYASLVFTCDSCDFDTGTLDELNKHILERHLHKTNQPIDGALSCHLCQFTSPSIDSISQHIKANHEQDEKYFRCDQCDFLTLELCVLKTHSAKHDVATSSSRNLNCSLCSFKPPTMSTLIKHSNVDHLPDSDNKFNCNMCDFKSFRRSHVAAHVQRHIINGDVISRPFQCRRCDLATGSIKAFSEHLTQEHCQGEGYRCMKCEYLSDSSLDFGKHQMQHIEEEGIVGQVGLPCTYCNEFSGNFDHYRLIPDGLMRKFKLHYSALEPLYVLLN